MSLSVKILQKAAGTKTRTKSASIGGLFESESAGYTPTNCTAALQTATSHYWLLTGTAGSALYHDYTTSVACVVGHKVYFTAKLQTSTAGVDSLNLYAGGSTGTMSLVATQATPVSGTTYLLSGILTLAAGHTGNIKLRFHCTDTSGATGTVVRVINWMAQDFTKDFGAGDEPAQADMDAFLVWRFSDVTTANYGLYNTWGDNFHRAMKIESHGLEYNDVVLLNSAQSTYPWSNVYVLNANWIICNTYQDYDLGLVVAPDTVYYWTKVDYTSRMLARTFNCNMRNDIDGKAAMSFRGDSTWQPLMGMTVMIYDGTECLFSGHISDISVSELNSTNWRCDVTVSSMLATMQWKPYTEDDTTFKSFVNTRNALDYVIFYLGNQAYGSSTGGMCFWRGDIDIGNSNLQVKDSAAKPMYEIVASLCRTSGLYLSISPDRRVSCGYPSKTPPAAPRNIVDGIEHHAQKPTYTEAMADFGNQVLFIGGSDPNGHTVYGVAANGCPISSDTFAGTPDKTLYVSDGNCITQTDADATAQIYADRYGLVIPGTFNFVTNDTDYRPGQKIEVQLAGLGMTSRKYMLIDEATLYDLDGINLQMSVNCSNRDNGSFSAAPNAGTESQMADASIKITSTSLAVTQQAGTFTPELAGSSTAGTWLYSSQVGTYVRHGNLVFVSINLVPSSISGSPTGNLIITGLPFTSAATPLQILPAFTTGLNFGTNMSQVQLVLGTSGTAGTMYGTGNNYVWTAIPVGNISTSDTIRISGVYQITP